MLKTLCGFLFLGALFVGCTCDFNCFMERQLKEGPKNIPEILSSNLCKNTTEEFDTIRNDVKECSVPKINVDQLEAFMNDICLDNGTLRSSFLRHEECLGTNFGTAIECMVEVGIETKEADQQKPVELFKSICKKIDEVYKCLNGKFATACGEEAGKLAQSFTSAFSTYTSGMCAEANGASVNHVLYVNILLGLLCVLIMSHKN